MSADIPAAPPGLSPEARKLWAVYNTGWQLDEHAQIVLRLALETFDRMRDAQRQIKTQGYKPTPKGSPNPYHIERDSRRDLLKLLRSLGLSLDPAQEKS